MVCIARLLVIFIPTVLTIATPLDVKRALPNPVDASTARGFLAQLTVEAESNSPPYDRKLFPHWIRISGSCDTRETVLKRDGTDVVTSSSCAATSGTWVSPYDDVTTTVPTDLDIDHLVPLREAWVSGARSWTTSQRQALANDLVRPQLVAVTDNLNQAKGDKDPARWMPPLASFRCTYVQAWVTVKNFYNLTVDPAEKSALEGFLANC
jgi:hypothetical protein